MQKTNTQEGRVREALKSLNYTKTMYGGQLNYFLEIYVDIAASTE